MDIAEKVRKRKIDELERGKVSPGGRLNDFGRSLTNFRKIFTERLGRICGIVYILGEQSKEILMITRFSIKNFKNFENEFVFDFSQTKQYEFSLDCVREGVVKFGLVYGPNSVGKSNLGQAMFDLVQTVTDKGRNPALYDSYQNARHSGEPVRFCFDFRFGENTARYEYCKTGYEDVLSENFYVNGRRVVERNRDSFSSNLKGTETLTSRSLNPKISAMRFIRANSVLEKDAQNEAVESFFRFADGMLMFSCLRENVYQGFRIGNLSVDSEIISRGKVKDLEHFLNDVDVPCRLTTHEINGQNKLYLDFGGENKDIDFWKNASTGTQSLVHFYFWFMQMQEKSAPIPSFIFWDEFDAYFHEKTARKVISMLMKVDCQAILTTHDSNLLTNELMRPDCAFNMRYGYEKKDGFVQEPLSSKTSKELRLAHNIPKMFRAGAFD